MDDHESWKRIDPPTPKLMFIIQEAAKLINSHLGLSQKNKWKVGAAWEKIFDGTYLFYHLFDSNNQQWTVKLYKCDKPGIPFFFEIGLEGFMTPIVQQKLEKQYQDIFLNDFWKQPQPYEVQQIINKNAQRLNLKNGQAVGTFYAIGKSWVSKSDKQQKYIVNLKSGSGNKYYTRINKNRSPFFGSKVMYVGQGLLSTPI